jgi:polyphosphate kinase 2 (PPK2 family)
VERVMGFCSEDQVEEFFRTCPEFERMLRRSGIILVKYWFRCERGLLPFCALSVVFIA